MSSQDSRAIILYICNIIIIIILHTDQRHDQQSLEEDHSQQQALATRAPMPSAEKQSKHARGKQCIISRVLYREKKGSYIH